MKTFAEIKNELSICARNATSLAFCLRRNYNDKYSINYAKNTYDPQLAMISNAIGDQISYEIVEKKYTDHLGVEYTHQVIFTVGNDNGITEDNITEYLNTKLESYFVKLKKEMTRTFYSVRYTGIGFNGTSTAWFDNKEDADKFAEQDYTDAPKRHSYLDPEKIADCERLVEYEKEFWD